MFIGVHTVFTFLRRVFEKNSLKCIIVPTPLVGGGGGGTIYSNGFFFVQKILADRYIHRREM